MLAFSASIANWCNVGKLLFIIEYDATTITITMKKKLQSQQAHDD